MHTTWLISTGMLALKLRLAVIGVTASSPATLSGDAEQIAREERWA